MAANKALIEHMEQGGVDTLLYGGNALAQHWPISKTAEWLDALESLVAEDTWLMPSVGCDGGKLVDQAEILAGRGYPVALLLPMVPPRTDAGSAEALRRFHGETGTQLMAYIKTDGYMPAADLEQLAAEGVLFGVKYAVPRTDGARDAYLDAIISAIGAERIISGFGEPPALAHMLDYGLAGFTAGCVCLAPRISMRILHALQAGDRQAAEAALQAMLPLEALRSEINEIRVLHEAIGLSGLAECGPVLALSSDLSEEERARVAPVAQALLDAERALEHETAGTPLSSVT
ncbi:dihydrodipicolinate synthase family protein [Oceanicola sp. D3]|nr:dihydrodipicolinate synthase family protein [Oceanicola sp. D3]